MVMFVVCLPLTVCAMFPRVAKAQSQDLQIQQDQSVVEAARHSREQMKNAARPARVITNDDLDTKHPRRDQEDFNTGTSTSPQTESPNASTLASIKAETQVATSVNKKSISISGEEESERAADELAEIPKLKGQLSSTQNDLIWQQRELLLNQNTVFSNPSYTATHAGQSDLNSMQLQIDQKQKEIEALKGPLANLEWRQWRRSQAGRPENVSSAENYKSVPPSALVLPQP
jgi:hypothetical protein